MSFEGFTPLLPALTDEGLIFSVSPAKPNGRSVSAPIAHPHIGTIAPDEPL